MSTQPRRIFSTLLAAAVPLGLYAYYRQVYRYRDPVRLPPKAPGMTAPADGKVAFIRRVEGGQLSLLDYAEERQRTLHLSELGLTVQNGWLVGVQLGPLDARYIYSPTDGAITALTRREATLGTLDALLGLAEQPSDLLSFAAQRRGGGAVDVAMANVGGRLAATTYFEAGQNVRRGNKLAYLEAGNLVLLAFEGEAAPLIEVGDLLTGAETLLTRERE